MKTCITIILMTLLTINLWAQDGYDFPPVSQLPQTDKLPDPWQFFTSDRRVTTSEDWEERRSELKKMFSKNEPIVTIYPAPPNEILSEDYILEVNGKPVDIYLAKIAEVENRPDWTLNPEDVGGPYSFSYFDFSGEVTIKITSLKKPLDRLVIRPLSTGIEPKVEGNSFTFTINRPCKLSIEPDGRIEPLLIFANPPEINPPKKDDPNVIYFGPGIHKPEKIKLTSGQTLYIAGGAIVKGGVNVSGNDIKITGRGILCGNDWPWRSGPGSMIRMSEAKNVRVEGIILRGSWGWTIPIYNSDSVSITNVKLVCSRNPNDDGINPCNSQRVYIRDCFIRTDDDCIAMKGIKFGSTNDNVEYITLENCLLWADRARIFLLGHESRAKYMRDVKFNSYQDFDFDFWSTWAISDIGDNINKCKSSNSSADRKIIAREHANLNRLLGKRPEEPIDPHRNEKHNFYILVNLAKEKIILDLDTVHKQSVNTIHDLTRALLREGEIDEQEAADIMNS